MKSSIKTFGFAFGLALAVAGPAACGRHENDDRPARRVWIPLGGQLKDMWEKAIPGLAVQVMPGAGIANVRGVEEGKADVGFGNSISTVDGVHGKPPFTKPHDQCLQPRHALSAILSSSSSMPTPASTRSRTSRARRSPRSSAATPAS